MPIELSPMEIAGVSSSTSPKSCNFSKLLPESLFVISLPRSLSSLVYHTARHAVGLNEPLWTSAGEVLNVDRYSLFSGPTNDTGRKFVQHSSEPRLFYAAADFLDQLVMPTGYAYKDVVQPFVMAEWLKRHDIRRIRIRRCIADVAFSMLDRNWHYPAKLFPQTMGLELALVQGLILAERALDSISAEQIDFDELILDERTA